MVPDVPQPEIEPTVPPTDPNPADPALAETPEPEIDYKTKFAESTREAQILAAQLEAERAKNARRDASAPSDTELQTEYPEWEYMSDTEKKLARQSFTATKTATALLQDKQEREEQARWNTELELAIAKEPALLGKEQGFKEFASKPTHRGAPLDVLVDAFLHKSGAVPPKTPTPSAPGLESGQGGPREPLKPKGTSAEDLKNLRENDYPAYLEYIKKHEISDLEV
jgi:hypothetical protein